MTTITLVHKSIQKKAVLIKTAWINSKMILICGIFFALIMLVFYVFQINNLTRGTYLIRDYNNKISSLENEAKKLETSFAQTSYLQDVQEKVKAMNFEKTTQVTYMNILAGSVATLQGNIK